VRAGLLCIWQVGFADNLLSTLRTEHRDYRELTDPVKHRRALKCLTLKSESQVDIFHTGRAVQVVVQKPGRKVGKKLTHGFLQNSHLRVYI